MYDSLLIRSGGGIVKESDLIRTAGNPALIIGLGGLGADALRALRRKMNVRMVPDHEEGFSSDMDEGFTAGSSSDTADSSSGTAGSSPGAAYFSSSASGPSSGSVRLLAIDAHAGWEGTPDFPDGIESLNIETENAVSSFSDVDLRKKNRSTPLFGWLSEETPHLPSPLYGAGSTRQLGRFFLIDSSQTVYARLRSILTELLAHVSGESSGESGEETKKMLSVHILSGLAGGMGGALADICYMVRHILEEAEPGFDRLYTYLFLPDILTSGGELANTYLVPTLERNSYAALKEMDYLMSMRENRAEFRQTYRFGEIRSRNTPADACFLLQAPAADRHSGSGPDLLPRDAAIDLLSEYLFAWITEEDQAAETSLPSTLKKMTLRVRTLPVTRGASCAFSVFGMGGSELISRHAATYVAGSLFNRLAPLLYREPLEQDLERFLSRTILADLSGIEAALRRGIFTNHAVPRPDPVSVKRYNEPFGHAPLIIGPINDWFAREHETIEKNSASLLSFFVDEDGERNPDSIIGNLFRELKRVMLDPACGPYFASCLVSGTGPNLIAAADRLTEEAGDHVEELRSRTDRCRNMAESAKQSFCASRNTITKPRAVDEAYDLYREKLLIWYKSQLDLDVASAAEDLLRTLSVRIRGLYTGYFEYLKQMLVNLRESFADNTRWFNALSPADSRTPEGQVPGRLSGYRQSSHSRPEGPLIDLRLILPELDWLTEDLKAEETVRQLVLHFLAYDNEWLSGDELRIRSMIGKFVLDLYGFEIDSITKKSYEEYLSGPNWYERDRMIADRLFSPMIRTAKPDIRFTAAFRTEPLVKPLLLSCPARLRDIRSAAERLCAGKPDYVLQEAPVSDRVRVIRFYGGISPYGLSQFAQLKSEFDRADIPGILLDEGEAHSFLTLPPPVPYSLDPEATGFGHAAERIFRTAKRIGLIEVNDPSGAPFENAYIRRPVFRMPETIRHLEILRCLGPDRCDDELDFRRNISRELEKKYLYTGGKPDMDALLHWIRGIRMLKEDMREGDFTYIYIKAPGRTETTMLDHIIRSPYLLKQLFDLVEYDRAADAAQRRLMAMKWDFEDILAESGGNN